LHRAIGSVFFTFVLSQPPTALAHLNLGANPMAATISGFFAAMPNFVSQFGPLVPL